MSTGYPGERPLRRSPGLNRSIMTIFISGGSTDPRRVPLLQRARLRSTVKKGFSCSKLMVNEMFPPEWEVFQMET